jgi:acetamidase/formamidase
MTTHHIEPRVDTVHYDFSRERAPILEIDSDDTVVYRTLDAGAYLEPRRAADTETKRMHGAGAGHALCGPVSVRGARPGQTLAVELIEIRTGSWGWTGGGGFSTPLNDRLGVTDGSWAFFEWTLDPDKGTACNQYGHIVDLKPFMGVIGLPPDEDGSHPTGPPRFCGGNLDCKELVAGSTLYLPITVDGALFSIGDGHGRQGDGEVSGMAIECPMERVEVKLTVLDELQLKMPRAQTPSGWITFGLGENIEDAIHQATDEMLDFLVERGFHDRKYAIAFASIVVDVRVTQLVNGVVGAHAVLPWEAYR